MTREESQLHVMYESAPLVIREAVDAAYDAVRLEFTQRGFNVDNSDPAEICVAAIYKYLVDSALPTIV
jgi:hypothetical protein